MELPTAHSLIRSLNQPKDTPVTANTAKINPKTQFPVFIPTSNAAGKADAAILPNNGQGLKPNARYTKY